MRREGLTRHSYATYRVSGPLGEYLIRRNGKRCYYVSKSGHPNVVGFFDCRFRLLRDAAAHAALLAGVDIPFDPVRDLPACLDRRGKAA